VPFGVANAALLAAWPRLRTGWRAASTILFGLLWALAVIPYHVVPLLEGAVTGQNVTGLFRLVGGAAMVAVGVAILRRRREAGDLREDGPVIDADGEKPKRSAERAGGSPRGRRPTSEVPGPCEPRMTRRRTTVIRKHGWG
jgi:hypothetical protein